MTIFLQDNKQIRNELAPNFKLWLGEFCIGKLQNLLRNKNKEMERSVIINNVVLHEFSKSKTDNLFANHYLVNWSRPSSKNFPFHTCGLLFCNVIIV